MCVLVTVSESVRGLVSVLACESVLGVRRLGPVKRKRRFARTTLTVTGLGLEHGHEPAHGLGHGDEHAHASRIVCRATNVPVLSNPSCVSKNSVNVDAASAGPERKTNRQTHLMPCGAAR